MRTRKTEAEDEYPGEGIISRRFIFCPTLQDNYTTDELAPQCAHCGRFFVLCCQDRDRTDVCHHYRLAFTDGACLSNGKDDATAGLGIAIGDLELGIDHWAIPVEDFMDSDHPKRTSQRTELLAAIEGLDRLRLAELATEESKGKYSKGRKSPPEWVIATDSEYVVKGITEWFPSWKRRGWRTSKGQVPVNLDLFQKLDGVISQAEREGINVGFWHIRREFNTLADSLAKRGAKEVPKVEYAISVWI